MTTHAEVKELADRALAAGRQLVVMTGGTLDPDLMDITRRTVIEYMGGMFAFLRVWSLFPTSKTLHRDFVSDALPHDCEDVIDMVLADLDELHGGGRAERKFKANGRRY